jgi:hypothetical protein
MTTPETALQRARSAAASMRAAGAYPDGEPGLQAAPPEISTRKLLEWAMIEPDLSSVRSTRRLGAPMTALKRLLVRLLMQYHAELLAQQTRFNIATLAQLGRLEDRFDQLERRLSDQEQR